MWRVWQRLLSGCAVFGAVDERGVSVSECGVWQCLGVCSVVCRVVWSCCVRAVDGWAVSGGLSAFLQMNMITGERLVRATYIRLLVRSARCCSDPRLGTARSGCYCYTYTQAPVPDCGAGSLRSVSGGGSTPLLCRASLQRDLFSEKPYVLIHVLRTVYTIRLCSFIWIGTGLAPCVCQKVCCAAWCYLGYTQHWSKDPSIESAVMDPLHISSK